jgi:membrane-bound lytic murein transglycosylase D
MSIVRKVFFTKIFHKVTLSFLFALVASSLFANPNIEGFQVYQKNLHLSPERQQILAADIDRYRNADDMWDVLRREFSLPHYEDNPLVQEQITWFLTHQDFLKQSATRAAPYLYYILQQAHKRHLPAELVLLPVFESSYNPFAYSSAGAAGIWQMMPGTATGYGIKQDWWYDGRRDVLASTKAALNYLFYLSNFFNGNWLLAVAAYDTGEGNVLNAIRKNISNGESSDYWSLPLAQETRTYVPRLLALATIIANPEKYPVYLPPVHNAPYLAQIDVGMQMDLKHAATLAGLSLKKLMQLNSGFNRLATSPTGPYKLVLPIESVGQFSKNLSATASYQQLAWQHYKIKVGDTLVNVSRRYHAPIALLKKMNPLIQSVLRPGSSILIPRGSNEPQTETIEDNLPIKTVTRTTSRFMKNHVAQTQTTTVTSPTLHYILQPGDTIYMARANDNLASIARRFHVNEQDITNANPYPPNSTIPPGQRLVIPTHLAQQLQEKHYEMVSGDTVYMIRKGDTIEGIAQKFHTTAPEIRVANLMSSNAITSGDRLVIPTHV